MEGPEGTAVPDANADADAEVEVEDEVELEHAKRATELARDEEMLWQEDYATYSRNLPPHTRFCKKKKRQPGLQKGRDPSRYAT